MRLNLKILAAAALLLFAAALPSANVRAEVESVSIAPAFITASISSDKPSHEETVTVKNNFSGSVRLSAQLYGVDAQTGKVSATEMADEALKNVVSISDTDFTLKPNKSINLKLLIRNSDDLAPGGHYAAILVKQIDKAGNDIGIQQALSLSLYIIKEDGAIRRLSADIPASPKISFSIPKQIRVDLKNSGNVVVIPRVAASFSSGDSTYSSGAANEESLPVAPKNNLSLNISLAKITTPLLPKKILQTVSYRYDGQEEAQIVTQSFWYIPWQMLISFAGLIAAVYWQRKKLAKIIQKTSNKLRPKKPLTIKKQSRPKLINDVVAPPKNKTKK